MSEKGLLLLLLLLAMMFPHRLQQLSAHRHSHCSPIFFSFQMLSYRKYYVGYTLRMLFQVLSPTHLCSMYRICKQSCTWCKNTMCSPNATESMPFTRLLATAGIFHQVKIDDSLIGPLMIHFEFF